ncbi:MAG: cell division protein ZapA [Gemmatimonadaceae bacterium]|jgi:cell division protein ZapA|nr:cell division protein ZapA [Gemmatimonadaceae bacterium]
MTEMLNLVKVQVGGEEVTIRSELPPEHALAVGAHVDEAIRRIREQSPMVDVGKAAILAALQIADELLRARRDAETGLALLRESQGELNRMLPPARRLG